MIDKKRIEEEAQHFFEWPDPKHRDTVTLTSCVIFASTIAEMVRAEQSRPLPDEWLVKVRRLVQGFEHVSGLARLWEPDYSSGSERALWTRATEACADVAKLLRDAEGPNDQHQRPAVGRSDACASSASGAEAR